MWETEYWHFLLSFGVIGGLAASLLFTPSIAAIGHFFKAKRGTATGIAATGAGLSGVVIPMATKALLDRLAWAWAIRILAAVMLCLSAVASVLVRSRLPPLKDAQARPDVRIFKQVPFLLTTLGIFLVEFGIFVPYTYISSYMLSRGFGDGLAYHSLAILNASGIVGRIVPGYLADKIGPFNCNILAALLSAVSCLAVWLPYGHTATGAIMFAVLIGFASGANIMSSPVCVGKLCKTQEYGRYYATTYTVVSFACLVSIPTAGEILDASGGDYWGLIIFTGCMYIGGFAMLVAAKISCVGWKGVMGLF
jgi:predicted MFS family arabinose efflux permease